MKLYKIFSVGMLLVLFGLVSCNSNNKKLTILKVTELGSAKLSDSALVKVLQNNDFPNINIEYSLFEDTALKRLRNNDVDFVIIPNNTPIEDEDFEVRTIAPLLPRVLMILTYNIPEENSNNLKNLLENNKLVYENLSRLDSLFFKKLFFNYGIDEQKTQGIPANSINIDLWDDSSFVFIGLTHLHNPLMKKLLNKGASIYSLDDISKLNSGSSTEGFCLDFPSASPFILPKSFYRGKPEHPVLTISILDILVCRKDLDENLVYDFTESLIEKKSQLVQYDNIYSMLKLKFEENYFSFPIHDGTLAFINKDKPPIWSRYASLIWPLVSMFAILFGLIASLHNGMKQRQKLRIETYYGALLHIRKSALKDKNKTNNLLKSLEKIRSDAFDALSNDKLVANESFAIFLSLYSDIRQELKNNIPE